MTVVLVSGVASSAPAAASGGAAAPKVAILSQVEMAGGAGGAVTATSYTDRKLNTIVSDVDGIIKNPASFTGTAGTNVTFTLDPGTYVIDATASAWRCGKSFLCVTTSSGTVLSSGPVVWALNADYVANGYCSALLPVSAVIVVAAQADYKLMHWAENNAATNGSMGVGQGYVVNTFTHCKITKIA